MSNALKCFSLARKTVLIAGASGGVGAHLARIAGCAGARVVLAAPRVGPLKEDAGSFMTGAVLAVDGGLLVSSL